MSDSGSQRSALVLDVKSTQALQELHKLTDTMKTLKLALADFNGLTVKDPLKDLPKEVRQAMKTAAAELESSGRSMTRIADDIGKESGRKLSASFSMQMADGTRAAVRATGKDVVKLVQEMSAEGARMGNELAKANIQTLEQVKASARAQAMAVKQAIAEVEAVQMRANSSRGARGQISALTVMPARDAGLADYYLGLERASNALQRMQQLETNYASTSARARQQAVASLTATNPELARMREHYTNLSTKTKELAANTDVLTGAKERLHTAMRGVSAASGVLFLTYTRYIGTMAVAFASVQAIQKSLQNSSEFDYQTRFVAALSDNYKPELYKKIQEDLKIASKDSIATLNENARALRVLQQTGVDASIGVGLLRTSMQAAVLGETDMKTATEDLVSVLEVFNLHSEDPFTFAENYKKTGDIIAFVSQETKANFHDVAQSLQGVVGVAQQYGVRLEEASAIITMLGKQGIIGPRAGTYTRSLIENIYVPGSGPAQRTFDELGFDAIDKATGKYKEFSKAVTELVGKLRQYDLKSQAAMIESLFPAWGAKAFRSVNNDLDQFLSLIKQSGDQTGLLEEQQKRLAESTRYQYQLLSAEFDNAFTNGLENHDDLKQALKDLRGTVADPEFHRALGDLASAAVRMAQGFAVAAEWIAYGMRSFRFGLDSLKLGALQMARLNPMMVFSAYRKDRSELEDETIKSMQDQLDTWTQPWDEKKPDSSKQFDQTLDPIKYGANGVPLTAAQMKKTPPGNKSFNPRDRNGEAEARRMERAYAQASVEISKYIDQLSIEDQTNLKLTRGQEIALGIMNRIADGTSKMTTADKIRLEGQLRAMLVDEDAILVKKKLLQAEADHQEAVRAGEEARAEGQMDIDNAELAENAAKREQLLDINRDFLQQEDDLNISLIKSDKARVLAQMELERQRKEDQIRSLSDGSEESVQLVQDMVDKLNEIYGKQREAISDTYEDGVRDAMADYLNSVGNAADQSRKLFTDAMQGMEDSITKFVMTGKLRFDDLAESIIEDLIRMQVRKSITEPLGNFFTENAGSIGSTLMSIFSANGNAFTGSGVHAFANGGAFGSGSVLTRPTMFPFAMGGAFGMGVAGEAGPEAALPLKRMNNGKLGVHTDGGVGGATIIDIDVAVSVQSTEVAGDAQGADLGKAIASAVQSELIKQKRPGGLLA